MGLFSYKIHMDTKYLPNLPLSVKGGQPGGGGALKEDKTFSSLPLPFIRFGHKQTKKGCEHGH